MKLLLLADDIILYLENPKGFTKENSTRAYKEVQQIWRVQDKHTHKNQLCFYAPEIQNKN